MRVRVESADPRLAAEARQRLQYQRNALQPLAALVIRVDSATDPFGVPLFRCRLRARAAAGREVRVEETQAEIGLALGRCLDRCVRVLRRRASRR